MGNKLFSCSLLCAVLLSSALEINAEESKKKPDRPFIAVIQKDGKKLQRRCYKDEDKNGFCDNGSEQKWKCPNNCRAAVTEDGKKEKPSKEQKKRLKEKKSKEKKQGTLPCSGCPLAGNCSGGCLALF